MLTSFKEVDQILLMIDELQKDNIVTNGHIVYCRIWELYSLIS